MRGVAGFMTLLLTVMLSAVLLGGCGKDDREYSAPADTGINPSFAAQVDLQEQALGADPDNPALLVQLGNLYYDWGEDDVRKNGELAQPYDKWEKGIRYYGRALDLTPSNVDVRVDMANLLRFTGRTDEAIAQYRRASEIDPKHPQARINLIIALGQIKQDYKSAIKEYENLVKALPEQAGNEGLKQEVSGFRDLVKEAEK